MRGRMLQGNPRRAGENFRWWVYRSRGGPEMGPGHAAREELGGTGRPPAAARTAPFIPCEAGGRGAGGPRGVKASALPDMAGPRLTRSWRVSC